MAKLVAIDLAPGQPFVTALMRIWDAGDAALPIDQRLPGPMRARLMTELAAAAVLDATGTSALAGRPVEVGDALVLPTSGSTGQPKGVVLTHDALAASARMTSAALHVDSGTDRWLACLPLSHIGGLSVVIRAILTSTPLDVHERFDAKRCMDAARDGATLVSLVPTVLPRVDAGLFRKILLGGSAASPGRPPNSVATYGMTETGSGVVYDGVPLEGVEIAIIDGEIMVRSPTLLRCYRDDSTPVDTNGWLATGDGGGFDDKGRLVVHGRLAEVIVTGAEMVWPGVVEAAMSDLPWVDRVAVTGRADEEWGQLVTAIVQPAPGTEVPSLAQVRDELRGRLAPYALPRAVESVDEIAVTASGKIRRDRL